MTILFTDRVSAHQNGRGFRIGVHPGNLVRGITAAGSVFAIAFWTPYAVVELVGLIYIDEGVEALVHPCVAALVGLHGHGKPGVADFVRRYGEEALAPGVDSVEDEAGILHARGKPCHVDASGVWVDIPVL